MVEVDSDSSDWANLEGEGEGTPEFENKLGKRRKQ